MMHEPLDNIIQTLKWRDIKFTLYRPLSSGFTYMKDWRGLLIKRISLDCMSGVTSVLASPVLNFSQREETSEEPRHTQSASESERRGDPHIDMEI